MTSTLDIRHWQDIDAQYISDVFARCDINAKVEAIESSPVGTGKVGECVRFELDLSKASAPETPRTLIGKFPADADHSRSFGAGYGLYAREVNFYQILKPDMQVATPHCYFVDIDPNTQNFVLIMSDAAPAVAGNQLRGVTLNEAKTIIIEAAKLHASFWKDDSLNDYPWVINTVNSKNDLDLNILPPIWDGFLERYESNVSQKAKQIGQSIFNNLDVYDRYRSEQFGLTHGDFRPDNMLFAGPEGGEPLTIVDWQSVTYGPVATDIGYCIAGALPPELRRQNETELLALYQSELKKNGALDYKDNDLRRHYITGGYQLFITAFSSAMMTAQAEESDQMFFKMFNGAVEFICDHNAESFDF